MHYCLGYDSRAFWPSWVSGSLKGVMPAPLHVLVALLCSAYMSSCSLHFLSFSVRFIAHSVCDTVWYYFIIFQLHCLGSFLAVVGLVGVFSVHHFAGSCGEQTFLDLTIAGVLPQTRPHCIQPSAACQLDYFWLCLLQPCHLLLLQLWLWWLLQHLPHLFAAKLWPTLRRIQCQPSIQRFTKVRPICLAPLVVASSLVSGTLRLPPFDTMFPSLSAITSSNLSTHQLISCYVHFLSYRNPCDQHVFRFGHFHFLIFLWQGFSCWSQTCPC